MTHMCFCSTCTANIESGFCATHVHTDGIRYKSFCIDYCRWLFMKATTCESASRVPAAAALAAAVRSKPFAFAIYRRAALLFSSHKTVNALSTRLCRPE